ncbi:flagellar biosynthesis protein FlhF [Cohnella suwonensis]|uniref:Flagellar biosynthesis protein FlhF n=1 Tax=Cohnella suwonensis TaxID=696072 RepID=A0ABW0M1K5_9BACL
MKVKRYIVDQLPEAVQQIRAELGSDAVILNTKEIRVGGFLGMFRKKRVEVIAAVDESSKKPPARKPAFTRPSEPRKEEFPAQVPFPEPSSTAATPLPPSAIRDRYVQAPFSDSGRGPNTLPPARETAKSGTQRAESIASVIAQAIATKEREPDTASPPSGAANRFAAATERFVAPNDTAQESRQYGTEMNAEPHSSNPGTRTAVLERTGGGVAESEALLQELRSMKEMMAKLTKQQTFRTMPASVMKWSKRLAEQGVEPSFVEQFAEETNARLSGADEAGNAAAYEAAREVLFSWICGIKGQGIEQDTRVVHFVGPTGVGKTTTIAKLAAEQAFVRRRNVGFITADTYRIAAVDQLRTYADILNLPLEVVFSPGELARAYAKLADRDLLFMDTAGRNYRNELFVSEVNSLLAPGDRTETVLVLSMTHKYADMKLVVSQFMKYGVKQLLLSKFDETDSYGAIVNLAKEFDLTISYYTCGQAVPDDIRPFEPEDIVNRLLGEPGDD